MKRVAVVGVAVVMAGLVATSSAANAAGPPLPKEVSGKKVNLYTTGVDIPTQFAFAGKNMFIAGGAEGKAKGGVFVREPGLNVATKVPGTGKNAFGVAFSDGKLYVSHGDSLMAYGKWNGKRFLRRSKLFNGPRKSFTSFNGIAFGPDSRLYVGVSMESDHAASKRKYANSVISMTKAGKGIKIISRGLRQPWMMAFAKGEKSPIVSDLAQDAPKGTMAPDQLVKAKPGDDFGFPSCTWEAESVCGDFSKPLMIFPALNPSPSPMGIAARGKKLYVALFGGLGQGPEVISTNTGGSAAKPVMTGFVAPVLSVAYHRGFLYAGDLTGSIYRVHN